MVRYHGTDGSIPAEKKTGVSGVQFPHLLLLGKIMKQNMKRNIRNFSCTCVDGWLDRRGKFYSCEFNHHNDVELQLMKKLELKYSLEYLGWVKVHSAGVYFYEAQTYMGRMHVHKTESQIKWLLDNGYEIVG